MADSNSSGGRKTVNSVWGSRWTSGSSLGAKVMVAETGVQLPGGGQVLFPGHRLVAMYGHPGTPGLGALGEQGLAASIARIRELAKPYHALSGVHVVPAFASRPDTPRAGLLIPVMELHSGDPRG